MAPIHHLQQLLVLSLIQRNGLFGHLSEQYEVNNFNLNAVFSQKFSCIKTYPYEWLDATSVDQFLKVNFRL